MSTPFRAAAVWAVALLLVASSGVPAAERKFIRLVHPDGHARGGIDHIVYSPDGRVLATAGKDQTVRLWEVGGQPLAVLDGRDGGAAAVAFSPDGRRVATAGRSDGAVRVWDARTGAGVHVLRGHEGGVGAVAFHPAVRLLTSAGTDGTVRTWDPAAGTPAGPAVALAGWEKRPPIRPIRLTLTADGTRVAAEGENPVRIWDAATGKLVAADKEYPRVEALAFDPAGGSLSPSTTSTTAPSGGTRPGCRSRRSASTTGRSTKPSRWPPAGARPRPGRT